MHQTAFVKAFLNISFTHIASRMHFKISNFSNKSGTTFTTRKPKTHWHVKSPIYHWHLPKPNFHWHPEKLNIQSPVFIGIQHSIKSKNYWHPKHGIYQHFISCIHHACHIVFVNATPTTKCISCISKYTYTYNHSHIHSYIQTYIDIYMHTYNHSYIHIIIHIYIHTYSHSHVHTYVHIHVQHANRIIHTYCIDHHVSCFNKSQKESSTVYLVQRCLYHSYKT